MSDYIIKTKGETQSGYDRQAWAEGLIRQLPKNHDGRNSWLLNYGRSDEAKALREAHHDRPRWDAYRQAATNGTGEIE